jgi:hypothetical protein
MKTIFAFTLSFFALLVACKQEVPVVADTTCDVPDAGLTYKMVNGYQAGASCSFLKFVIGRYFSDDRHIVLISGDRKRLKLSKTEQVFDLSKTDTLALKVSVYKYKDIIQYPMFCNDLVYRPANIPIEKWDGIAGKIAIQIEKDSIGFDAKSSAIIFYTMNLKVTNCIVMKKPDNTNVKIETPIIGTIMANF